VDGIDVNIKDQHGQTALMWASRGGHAECVNELLQVDGIDAAP